MGRRTKRARASGVRGSRCNDDGNKDNNGGSHESTEVSDKEGRNIDGDGNNIEKVTEMMADGDEYTSIN